MKKLLNRLMSWLRPAPAPAKPTQAPKPRVSRTKALLSVLEALAGPAKSSRAEAFKRYEPLPGVVPNEKLSATLARDSTPYDNLNQMFTATGLYGADGLPSFPGYPYLAQLAQLPEYRKMVCTMADEMTRKWIRIGSASDEDATDKIRTIEEAMKKLNVRELIKSIVEDDGFYGRGQFYVDVRKPNGGRAMDDVLELRTPLPLDKIKIRKGSLIGFNRVEPVWVYPANYNSTNPLANDFYKPSSWFVMGKEVHQSRLRMVISHPVPDLLKATYSFGGISMTQLAEPYVRHWLRTRDSVSDIIHSFSTSGLKTSMDAYLAPGDVGGGDDLIKRAQLFNKMRDNRGMLLIDKDGEDFFQFNVPLSSLDHLQAQSQEQMSAVSSIPLVKLLGITPTGLNASSDGEVRVFYDFIAGRQESLLRKPITDILRMIQLNEFGEVDDSIDFAFEPLYQLNDTEKAAVRKTNAETDQIYIDAGVVSQDEVRGRIATEDEGPYHGLDANDLPDAETGDTE